MSSLSWQVGWIVGPAAGGFALQHAPLLLWPIAAAVNIVCAAGALMLEQRLPERVRLTPYDVRPEPLIAGSAG
jgi:MFS family permease